MRARPRDPFAQLLAALLTAVLPVMGIIIYLILLASHISLIYLLPYFPSQDGPAHLYHLDILSDLLDGGKIWGKHFEFNFRLVPNLGFHLLSYPLLKFFSLFTVERIFLSLYLIFIAISIPYW